MAPSMFTVMIYFECLQVNFDFDTHFVLKWTSCKKINWKGSFWKNENAMVDVENWNGKVKSIWSLF